MSQRFIRWYYKLTKKDLKKIPYGIKSYLANVGTEKLDYLRDLIEAGKIRSAIDKVYPLSEIAKAHRYYEEGHTAGKIVISLQD